ncbi:SDR family NAD(P)-dependent oxidoreductase [Saccharopolyspora phatthalungensis]|uniref:Acyl-CoA synthetase (AMP-forming)/AMP-acid ligase II/NAD(P)-dependent dehydrogenase (Short-subunit alcohol dehydrogenase family) n=1 Tax=Saccharopolyspora phatthalungensis TaxID=664693 RepID=A0A840Q7J5_9PSEU|nr:SDR family NAD(P)-dependent oxidoreductase [Saccharopolyspora phatthalungensis]MBB5158482.1 acyl-CoA synthetase (AMP-forming)/AMP-acid ligase II/NAD(P)-dependent dehydrogenase (short-subunit alcohol dehydrogenase family) [Saccharopolyspora phatthalungensis]
MSSELMADLAEAVRAQPGVADVACAVRKEARTVRTEQAPTAPEPVPETGSDGLPLAEVHGGELPADPTAPKTLAQALRLAAELAPDRGTVLLTAEGGESFQSYAELFTEARELLAGLRKKGLLPGDSVLFQFADNRNFVTAFWACVLGGFVPTPCGVPLGFDRENAGTRKLRNAWELLEHPVVLTDSGLLDAVNGLGQSWHAEFTAYCNEELRKPSAQPDLFPAEPDDPVVQLLTSGSTGVPKCVRHANASIVARTLASAAANGFDEHDVSLNWIPLDHVGGVIMHNVGNVVLRNHHVNAETDAFLADPLVWMDWVHRFRVTNTWAPNFAFSLFNDNAHRVADRDWDLSCLRHICNGGEAVVTRTAQRFLEVLRPFGLPADSLLPTFGMSEIASGTIYSTLSGDDPTQGTISVEKTSLGGRLRVVEHRDTPEVITFTEVGRPLPGLRMRIVDDRNRPLPEDHVGRLQFSGSTMMTGYYRNPEANRKSYTEDGWFNSGDLGFIHDGRLTLTGRDSDLIVVQGVNYLNFDIESIVEQVPGTEVTFVAACGDSGAGAETEKLVVFFVPTSPDVAGTVTRIKARLADEIGLQPHLVVPVERSRFPKTNSGKIQRSQLIADLHAGKFDDALRDLVDAPDEPVDSSEWFFERVWTEQSIVETDRAEGVRVLFADEEHEQRFGQHTVVVVPGTRFSQNDGRFSIDPENSSHYHDLFAAVRQQFGPVDTVLHAWAAAPSPNLDAGLRAGPYSVRLLLAELASGADGPAVLVFTANGLWVREGDAVDVPKSALPGLVRTAVAEGTVPLLRQVDLPAENPERWAGIVRSELAAAPDADVVAHRAGIRLVPRLRPVPLDLDGAPDLVQGGVYAITGGLGGIAYQIAEYLLATYQARLLLIGRSPISEGSVKAERLADLRMLGEVEYRSLDIGDTAALHSAVAQAERRWERPLSGILHLASNDVSQQWARLEEHTVARASRIEFAETYRAKVHGTMAIAEVLRNRPDTLLVLFSSVNGEFGGSSFGAYSSANSFLNGFADYWGREQGRPVRCLSWSMWTGSGMNQGSPSAAAASRGFVPIDDAGGLASLLAALGQERVNLLIGLDRRNEHIVAELAPEHLRSTEIVVAYSGDVVEEQVLRTQAASVLARSEVPVRFTHVAQIPRDPAGAVDQAALLAVARAESQRGRRKYAEPETELERKLAAIWGDVLGHERIGRDDAFFELGGNSLRAAQLVARINGSLPMRVAVHQLYDHPTVGRLAKVLEASR